MDQRKRVVLSYLRSVIAKDLYYHVGLPNLKPGDIIKPSSLYTLEKNWPDNEGQEKFLEDIRNSEFPSRPSRIGSVYVSDTKEEAKYWAEKIAKRRSSSFYEVSVSGILKKGTFDASHLREMRNLLKSDKIEEAKDIARDYWKSFNKSIIKGSETIINGGKVYVVKEME